MFNNPKKRRNSFSVEHNKKLPKYADDEDEEVDENIYLGDENLESDEDDIASDDEYLEDDNEMPNKIPSTVLLERQQTFCGAPNFYNYLYYVKNLTTHDIPTFTAEEYRKALVFKAELDKNPETANKYDVFLCASHGPRTLEILKKDCDHCYQYAQFPYSFNIQGKSLLFTFPPTTIYSSKSINYFKQFIRLCTQVDAEDPQMINKQLTFYTSFKNQSFIGGPLSRLISGKMSFVRKKMLAFPTHGLRNTLTVRSDLSPNYARIPRKLYDSVKLETPIAVLNRAPSISSQCLYFLELIPQDEDDTIHIPPDCLDGLHADQDGDDLTIFIILNTRMMFSLEMKACLEELRRGTWKYGNRRTLLYKPRHSFSQYHRFILHKYDDVFKEMSDLWNSLTGSIEERIYKLMALGCSIAHEEVDAFLQLVGKVTRKLPMESISANDILNGDGILKTIVNSGAKGSMDHIHLVKKDILDAPDDFLATMVEKGFNKFIKGSDVLSRNGVSQFTLLYAFNSITLHQSKIYINNDVLFSNLENSTMFSDLLYNDTAVNYVFDGLLLDEDVFEEIPETFIALIEQMLEE